MASLVSRKIGRPVLWPKIKTKS